MSGDRPEIQENAWRALVDIQRLEEWMDFVNLGGGPIRHMRLLAGGTQNVLLLFERDGREFVLRRPPLHPYMDGNETMRREARILHALAGSEVPHPALIAACTGTEVLGASFYLMEHVEGFNATLEMPQYHRDIAARRTAMGLALIDAIAALGRIDHESVSLPLRSNPTGYLPRQVRRWRSQLDRYSEYDGWDGPATLPYVDRVGGWLEANCPRAFRPGLVHGDYHLANVLFDRTSSNVAAIVDWELSAVGDPLLDLGWLIATWPNPDGTGGTVSVDPWVGFPTTKALIEHYRRSSDRDTSAIGWYAILACYKLGILLEGTHARASAGMAPTSTGDLLHQRAVSLFERAAELVRGGGRLD